MTTSTPNKEQVLEEAAYWFACLQSEDVSAQEKQAWQTWHNQSSLHQEVWQQVERVDRQYQNLPKQHSYHVLHQTGRSRRQFLLGMMGLAVAAPIVWQQRQDIQATWLSGETETTQVGEVRHISLKDGIQLWLNTDSLVTIDQQVHLQQFHLLRGELFVESASGAIPLQLATGFGQVSAIGANFSVRLNEDHTYLAVHQGSVTVTADSGSHTKVQAKQSVLFNRTNLSPLQGLSANDEAWRRGYLVADNMRLDEFIELLNRYHPNGWLKCSANASHYRLVGHYSLADTEKVLDAIAFSLPVNVRKITPWFTILEDNKNISHS